MERPADGMPGRVAYSARSEPGALPPGLQDRLSWLLQLQAWLSADPQALLQPPTSTPGRDWPVAVASPGGDQQAWRLRPVHDATGLLYLRHEAARPYDNHVELWLQPTPPHWPVRLVIRAARGDPLVLERVAEVAAERSTSGSGTPK
jgi:hypothetical protein